MKSWQTNTTYQTSTSDIVLQSLMDSRYEPLRSSVNELKKRNKTLKDHLQAVGSSKDTQKFRNTALQNINKSQDLLDQIQNSFHDVEQAQGQLNINFRKLLKIFDGAQEDFIQLEESFRRKLQRTPVPNTSTKQKSDLATPLLNGDEQGAYDLHNTQLQRMKLREYDVDITEKRLDDMKHIEHQIVDIHAMQEDFNHVVISQQSDIDCMENNVVDATENIAVGAREVDKAAEYQRKKRNKMCKILMLLIIVAAVIGTIVAAKK